MKPNSNYLKTILLLAWAPVAAHAADIDVIGNPAFSVPSFASLNGGVDGGLGTNIRVINGTNVTWTNDNTYFITDKLFIPRGATLTIQPGTKIYSSIDDNGSPTNKTDDKVGSITACRGGKLIANGTAAQPIIFSSVREWEALNSVDSPFDTGNTIGPAPTAADGGQWGGIILLGQAFVSSVNSSGVNAGTVQIEGFAPAGSASYDTDSIPDATQYGVSSNFPLNNADNSGVIRYVSIRHGGYEFDSGREINGLTLGGVGSGTTIEYLEVYANQDDGIEFFGGTVNTRNIVMAFNQDDSFDIDEGYRGTNQFWFSIQNPGAADAGGEWDGVGGSSAGFNLGDTLTNHANPKIYNATIIGAGRSNTLSQLPLTTGTVNWEKGNHALHIEDYFSGEIYNSVFDDFAQDMIKYNDNAASTGVNFKFKHNTIGRFGDTPQKQVETSTVTISTVTAGTLNVTVTGAGITGSPLTVPVGLTAGDSRTVTTGKIRTALLGASNIATLYDVEQGTDRFVYLIRKTAGLNDGTLVVLIPASLGVSSNSSSNTQAGAATSVTPGDNETYITGIGPANVVFDAFGEPVDGNSNGNTDPQYTAYTRNGSDFLTSINPSPAPNSPLIGSAVSIAGGAPVAVSYRGAFAPGANSNWAAGWTKLSTSGVLLGAPASTGSLVDTDGDGISDTVESANTALGFNVNVSNGTPSTVFNGLFTSTSIQNLSADDIIVQKSGSTVNLTIPVESSVNLVPPFTSVGNATITIPNVPADKEFYRFRIPSAP